MTEQTANQKDVVLVEGVDEEPVERNRRLFAGKTLALVTSLATLHAAFHMLALNGVSIGDWTGVELPLLPQFPVETWNFRLVQIAGALALGFLLFNARLFSDEATPSTPLLSKAGYLLMIPTAVALYTVFGFMQLINSGILPEMGGLTTWSAFPGTEIYSAETYWFGIPLLIASLGGHCAWLVRECAA